MIRIHALLLAAVTAACSGAPPAAPPQGTPGEPSTGVPARLEVPGARDSGVQYVGRFDWAPDGARFSFAGTKLSLRFQGTNASVRLGATSGGLDDYGNVRLDQYDVLVDGAKTMTLKVREGVHEYPLATGLPQGAHEVTLIKRTEPWVGQGRLVAFVLDGGTVLAATSADRRIEFIGDSITSGLGVLGTSVDCDYSADLQDHGLTYAALAARALGADHVAVASSGVGVARNYDQTTSNTMADIYDRAVITDINSRWTFEWTPQAVVVNLGTVDYVSGPVDDAVFRQRYEQLLADVRGRYPGAVVFAMVGPMLNDLYPTGARALSRATSAIRAAVEARANAGDLQVELLRVDPDSGANGYGCDGHPSAGTHAAVADAVAAQLRQRMGW